MYHVGFAQQLDLIWDQSLGHLYLADAQDGRALIGLGYSGALGHVNRTSSEHLRGRGPIPRGLWLLDPPIASHPRLGPQVFPLEPYDAKTALGRSGFFIHGDNNLANNSASEGCIILDRRTRDFIHRCYWSAIRRLTVVGG